MQNNCNIDELKEKTLLLTQADPEKDMAYMAWVKNGLHADIIFTEKPKWIRAIRRFWTDGFLPGTTFWYGNWKNELKKYDTVILHASERTRRVATDIHKVKPDMRIIYWYWNRVNSKSEPGLSWDKNIELWSFDEDDCKKYNMHRNVQYYAFSEKIPISEPEYDLYFIGHDHGRREKIEEIKQLAEKKDLKVCVEIFRAGDENIPYTEVQKRTAKTKAILEVVQEGQVGCTLRALESLFYQKKLITNNFNIVKEDFYNPNNIFIYGKDDSHRLKEFTEGEYDTTSDQYRNRHTIDAWLMNFFKTEEDRCCL